ncbi:MAG: glycosyltransferase family 39 protein [Candidatus Omnitrophica bacterium]|nr:glycosyltransferase family 39 protein [Candidatus Omnitrophota bacterium]
MKRLWVLAAIVVVGAIPRFYQWRQVGLLTHDDAAVMNVTGTALAAANVVGRHAGDLLSHRWTLADVEAAVHAEFGPADLLQRGKPGLFPFLLLGAGLTGVSDMTPALWMACCSLAAALAVYLLGREAWGSAVGGVAGLLFVLSGQVLVFSRNYKMEIAPMWLWLTLGTWAYLRARRSERLRWVVLSGLLVGYAFTCHYSILLWVALFPLFELAWPADPAWPIHRRLRRVLVWAGVAVVPAVLFQLATLAIRQVWLPFITYWGSVGYQLSQQQHQSLPADPWYYLYFLWRLDGPASFLWLTFGAATLTWAWLRQRAFAAALLLTLCTVPLLVLSLSTASIFTVPRTLAPALPFLAVMAAVGLVRSSEIVGRRLPQPRLALALAVGMTAAVNLHQILPLTQWRAGYRDAVRFIASRTDSGVADLTDAPIWQFYLRRTAFATSDRQALEQLYRSGQIRYLAVSPTATILATYPSSLPGSILHEFQAVATMVVDVPTVAEFEQPVVGELDYLAEVGHLTRHQVLEIQRQPELRRIRLYDLAQLFGPLQTAAAAERSP